MLNAMTPIVAKKIETQTIFILVYLIDEALSECSPLSHIN